MFAARGSCELGHLAASSSHWPNCSLPPARQSAGPQRRPQTVSRCSPAPSCREPVTRTCSLPASGRQQAPASRGAGGRVPVCLFEPAFRPLARLAGWLAGRLAARLPHGPPFTRLIYSRLQTESAGLALRAALAACAQFGAVLRCARGANHSEDCRGQGCGRKYKGEWIRARAAQTGAERGELRAT